MPNALRIGLLGPLQVRDETGRSVHVGGRQLRVLLTLLGLNAGRVVPAGSLTGQIWPDEPPGNPGNALQTLVSRLRAELRQAGIGDVIESHPAGYRLAVPPEAVDVMAFEALAARGRRALADGDANEAARVLREALLAWRGQPLADAAGCDFADAAMLALYDRDPERAFAIFDRYSRSEDPWVRAAAPLLRGTFGIMLGRTEGAESECQAALAAFRALGEAWGTAAVLMQLADFAKLRGDYAAAIAALEEAAALGQELGAWGDLSHIAGKLALVQLRAGDLTAARANLERAERGDSERSVGRSDSAVWLGLVRAEFHFRESDTVAAARVCAEQLAWLDGKPSVWWHGLRAILQARLALAVLADGDEDRCRVLLADALRTASDWVELPALADVIDSIAVLTVDSAQPGRPGDPVKREEGAKLAATLLGAAHSVRGCFDEGSLDAPAARESVRTLLGPDDFEVAYGRGRALAHDDAVALAASTVANPAKAGVTGDPGPKRHRNQRPAVTSAGSSSADGLIDGAMSG